MSKKLNDKKSKAMGSIAAMQTLLERYPTLTTTDSMLTNFSVNTSVGFMLDVLSILGITQSDLINWISNLLVGKSDGTDGFLNVIENAVKGILLANVKDVFTCSVNPVLPDCFMKYSNPIFPDGTRQDPCNDIPISKDLYKKIEIDVNQIDMFGILSNCPSDSDNGIFYFDAYKSILDTEESQDLTLNANFKGSYDTIKNVNNKIKEEELSFNIGDIIKTTKGIDRFYIYTNNGFIRYSGTGSYSPNDLWKSCDFNAYLWYVINKGTLSNLSDIQRSTWDNRVRNIKKLKENQSLRQAFFDIETPKLTENAPKTKIEISVDNDSVDKQQILMCEFEERPTPTANEGSLPSSNVLRVWLNANRYYRTRHIKSKVPDYENGNIKKDSNGNIITKEVTLDLNKTVFEFNYDYIYSLKLFDTKTLVAQVVNSLLGISASISASLSVEQKMIEAKVGEITRKIIEIDDSSSSDCYFTFSNDDYDALLKETEKKYKGVYESGNEDGAYITTNSQDIITSLNDIKQNGTLVEQRTSLTKTLEEITAIASSSPSITEECKFSWGLNFIYDFIQQTVTQIALQVLTPKVAILYMINSAVMGGDVDKIKSWEDFLKNFQNVLIAIIKQIKDILIEELYKYIMEQLKPLLELMIAKIALETVQYYRDLIEKLLTDCIPVIDFNFTKTPTTIDNVNYADIVPEETSPSDNNKC